MRQISIDEAPEFRERSFPFVIHTAVTIERKSVLQIMKPLQGRDEVLKISWGASTYYLGHIGFYDICLVQSVAGSDTRGGSIDEVMEAIIRWKPFAVISIGIAFGKELDAKGKRTKQVLGDVLVSTQIIPYHQLKILPGGESEDRAPRPEASAELLNRVRNSDWSWKKQERSRSRTPVLGPMLSGPSLYNDPSAVEQLFKNYPTAIGGEMEAVGIYAVCGKNNVGWLIIKGICDWGKKKNDRYQPLAARNAVALLEVLLNESGLMVERSGVSSCEINVGGGTDLAKYRDSVSKLWRQVYFRDLTYNELVDFASELLIHRRFSSVWLKYGLLLDYNDDSFYCNVGHISLLAISDEQLREEYDIITGTESVDDEALDVRVVGNNELYKITARVDAQRSTNKTKKIVFDIFPPLSKGQCLQLDYHFRWRGYSKKSAARWHEFNIDVPIKELFLRVNGAMVVFLSVVAINNNEPRICSAHEYVILEDQYGFLLTIPSPKLFDLYRINFNLA